MSYQHPPRAIRCAQRVFISPKNKFKEDDTNVLSPGMIDTSVQMATAQTEKTLNVFIARWNDDISTCTKNIREYLSQIPNASPYARKQLYSYIERDLITKREAQVRLLIYKMAVADIKLKRCKGTNTQNKNCGNANLSFIDFCEYHQ